MNLSRPTLCLLFITALIAGCASEPAPAVTATYDPYTGFRTDLLENELTGPDQPREVLWLNAYRFAKDATKYSYYLEVRYLAREDAGYLAIPAGITLVLTLDDQTMRLSSMGSANTRKTARGGLVRETAIYEVTKEQLRQIGSARKVSVSVKGDNGLVERQFNQENIDHFHKFVLQTVGL